jgi:hypothetical protein
MEPPLLSQGNLKMQVCCKAKAPDSPSCGGTPARVPGTSNLAATAASDEGFKRRMPQAQQGSDSPLTCTYKSWVMLCKFASI